MVAFKERSRFESRSDLWWAHSETQGWVVLDRSFAANRTTTMPETMQFIRCADWSAYEQGEHDWDYREAQRYLNSLPPEQAIRARRELNQVRQQFEDTTVRWN